MEGLLNEPQKELRLDQGMLKLKSRIEDLYVCDLVVYHYLKRLKENLIIGLKEIDNIIRNIALKGPLKEPEKELW